ncbi:transcriptional regulator with XRE-family HTH domain [Chryseobacterium sp. BIGb0186]|nr:helix-turn-helix transcriptional regulator [Chryseobacterium sp. BIGb0186]MDH6210173.1 transcriptional regulator with XRE-family HTH domain [Chryseobacterium sp. BIGb0186]
MSIFADNIVFLRGQKNLTQHKLADDLILTRSRYVSYEYGNAEPPIEVLVRISKYYNISIDLLVTVDIRKYPLDKMVNLPGNKILLPVVVDNEGNKYIEIVPQKASMGYLNGFSDPEYIESPPQDTAAIFRTWYISRVYGRWRFYAAFCKWHLYSR